MDYLLPSTTEVPEIEVAHMDSVHRPQAAQARSASSEQGGSRVIRRLDHIIVCVHDRSQWLPRINRVLGLTAGRMLEGAGEGAGAFNNAEFAIGDGFLGVVEPSGASSQLHRFLARGGDGFYGMSIDVGDVAQTTAGWDAQEVDYRGTPGQGLVWLGPRRTHGVLYQVIDGMLLGQGANANYRGLSSLTIAVSDAARAADDYATMFALGPPDEVVDDEHGGRGVSFRCANPHLGQRIFLLEPADDSGAIAGRLAERGEGILACGIAVADLDAELARLSRLGVATQTGHGPTGARRARIDREALAGLRIELDAAAP
ncbi:MAG TPA: VOC family protein [Acidimicrobiales bacterium]|nr:VOC family protein [Acidimicrobiales bacterium]